MIEMWPLYIIVFATIVVLAVVLLSFLGPERSDKKFWIAVQRIRAVLDRGSYYIICAIAIGSILLAVIASIHSALSR